jgi:hypothetical protein
VYDVLYLRCVLHEHVREAVRVNRPQCAGSVSPLLAQCHPPHTGDGVSTIEHVVTDLEAGGEDDAVNLCVRGEARGEARGGEARGGKRGGEGRGERRGEGRRGEGRGGEERRGEGRRGEGRGEGRGRARKVRRG